jgi:hypothetical protein
MLRRGELMKKVIEALRGRRRSNPYFQQYTPINSYLNKGEYLETNYVQPNQNEIVANDQIHQYSNNYQTYFMPNNNQAQYFMNANTNNQAQYNMPNNNYQQQQYFLNQYSKGNNQMWNQQYNVNDQVALVENNQQPQSQWNQNYWPNQNLINRPPQNINPQNIYPKYNQKKAKGSTQSGFLTHFKSSDGSLDINKMMNTAGTMVNTVNQISSMVKSFGSLFIK